MKYIRLSKLKDFKRRRLVLHSIPVAAYHNEIPEFLMLHLGNLGMKFVAVLGRNIHIYYGPDDERNKIIETTFPEWFQKNFREEVDFLILNAAAWNALLMILRDRFDINSDSSGEHPMDLRAIIVYGNERDLREVPLAKSMAILDDEIDLVGDLEQAVQNGFLLRSVMNGLPYSTVNALLNEFMDNSSSPPAIFRPTSDPEARIIEFADSVKTSEFAGMATIPPHKNDAVWGGYPLLHKELKIIQAAFEMDLKLGLYFLLGPAGTGKSQFAKYVAKILDVPFFIYSPADVLDYKVGESEKRFRRFLNLLEQVPGVLLVDEIDKMFVRNETTGVHEHLAGMFLTYLQERKNPKMVIFATSNLGMGDEVPANIFRAVRSEATFLVDYPNKDSRESLFMVLFRKVAKTRSNKFIQYSPDIFEYLEREELDRLVQETEDFTGADIEAAISRAMLEHSAMVYSNPNAETTLGSFLEIAIMDFQKAKSSEGKWSPPRIPSSVIVRRAQ